MRVIINTPPNNNIPVICIFLNNQKLFVLAYVVVIISNKYIWSNLQQTLVPNSIFVLLIPKVLSALIQH